MTPVYKMDGTDESGNFRPISIISILYKTVEFLMIHRVISKQFEYKFGSSKISASSKDQ